LKKLQQTTRVESFPVEPCCQAVLVRFVITTIPIYLLVALKVPKLFIRAIDKIRKGFLWKGMKEANGGCCLVAWERVMRPLELG